MHVLTLRAYLAATYLAATYLAATYSARSASGVLATYGGDLVQPPGGSRSMACPHGQRLSLCRECGNGRWRTKRKEDDYHVITLEATAVEEYEEYEAVEEAQFELTAEVQQGYRAQDRGHIVWIVASYSGLADSQTGGTPQGLRDTTPQQRVHMQDLRVDALPHTLRSGETLVLSRFHMQRPKLTVSREQCKVMVAADGTADLVSCGKGPTLLRQSGSPWYAVSRSDTCPLADGDQISLDCNDPEAAVFTCRQVCCHERVALATNGHC